MPLIVDFLIPRRPVSHQSKNARSRDFWRDHVYGRARAAWPARPMIDRSLKFVMVYLADEPSPGDINNFVKPVQDALCACIYADDSMIRDVSAHMRDCAETIPTGRLPKKLAQAINSDGACVYVAIHDSINLAEAFE